MLSGRKSDGGATTESRLRYSGQSATITDRGKKHHILEGR